MKSKLILLALMLLALWAPDVMADCADLEDETWRRVEFAGRCEEDSDCIRVDAPCPFGCDAYINKKNEKRVRSAFNKYYVKCGTCKHECTSSQGTVSCVKKSCKLVPPGQLQN